MKPENMIRRTSRRPDLGFTIVEISIFLVFFGLFAGLAVNSMIAYQTQKWRSVTETNLSKSHGAIVNFFAVEGRYPCPADPRLGPDDAEYGLEKCTDGDLPSNPSAVNDGRLVNVDQTGAAEEVMAGSIPFRTIEISVEGVDFFGTGDQELVYADAAIEDQESVQNLEMKDQLSEDLTLDGYGNKLTYAVTKELTAAPTFDENRGAIVVVDEFTIVDGPFFASLIPSQARMAHYVIVSHGADGKGAYSRDGTVSDVCITVSAGPPPPPPPPPPTPDYADQEENCDIASTAEMDAAFISALYNTTNDQYYDDQIIIGDLSTAETWSQSGDGITSLNEGNVGVGTEEPEEKLHVNNGNLRGNKVKSPQYCDLSESYCITSDMIADPDGHPDMECPPDQVIKGIYNGQVHCETAAFTMLNAACPGGSYLQGVTVSASGTTIPICFTPAGP